MPPTLIPPPVRIQRRSRRLGRCAACELSSLRVALQPGSPCPAWLPSHGWSSSAAGERGSGCGVFVGAGWRSMSPLDRPGHSPGPRPSRPARYLTPRPRASSFVFVFPRVLWTGTSGAPRPSCDRQRRMRTQACRLAAPVCRSLQVPAGTCLPGCAGAAAGARAAVLARWAVVVDTELASVSCDGSKYLLLSCAAIQTLQLLSSPGGAGLVCGCRQQVRPV